MHQPRLPRAQRHAAQRAWRGAPIPRRGMRNLILRAVPSAEPSKAVESSRHSKRPTASSGWAQKIAETQSTQLRRLDRAADRLQNQLLNLDTDDVIADDGTSARVRSNATASSSFSEGSGSNSWDGRQSRRRSDKLQGNRRRRRPFRAVPPSPEVLVALLRRTDARRKLLQQLDVQSPRAVASRLLQLSALLDLSPGQLVAMTRNCGRLLLRRPDQLQAALAALVECLKPLMPTASSPTLEAAAARSGHGQEQPDGLRRFGSAGDGRSSGEGTRAAAGPEAMAREMAAAAPELLLVAPQRLRRSGLELGAVCKARGVKVLPMLAARPDLLLQSAASLAAKMDVLPGLLGLPPRRLREVLAARPDLLRRSPRQLFRRHQLLGQLCGVPSDFLAELIAQEPGVLGFGADTLRAKFDALARQYGRFQDDVADMILVDPTVLVKASPAPKSVPTAATTAVAPAKDAAKETDRGNQADVLPVLDQLRQLSEASGIPMGAVLQLVAQEERVCSYSPGAVAAQLAALAAALGLSDGEVRSRVAEHPPLLLLPMEQMAGRVEAVTRLLQSLLPAPAESTGTSRSAHGAGTTALALLQRHPELLLQEPGELCSRLAQLSQLVMGTAPLPPVTQAATALPSAAVARPLAPQLLALVAAQPALLTAPAEETADKLLVMQSLFEIPRALVLELISKEPALLAVSAEDLERKFRALAASFGAFSSDAIDVVFADPSLILRADSDSGAILPAAMLPALRRSRRLPQRAAAIDVEDMLDGRGGRGDGSSSSSTSGAAASSPEQQQQRRGSDNGKFAQAAVKSQAVVERRRGSKQRQQDSGQHASQAPPQQRQDYAEDLLLFAATGRTGTGDAISNSREDGGSGASGTDSSGGGGGKSIKDIGLLGTMSAADFDRLGSEDLPPPPPPPSGRRRRRLQQ